LRRWVDQAAAGASLLVFPEYGAMELAALDPVGRSDLLASLGAVSDLLPRVDALHRELARAYGVYASRQRALPGGGAERRFVNRARFSPHRARSAIRTR
jgi:predicted amidohydrolase